MSKYQQTEMIHRKHYIVLDFAEKYSKSVSIFSIGSKFLYKLWKCERAMQIKLCVILTLPIQRFYLSFTILNNDTKTDQN